MYLFILFVIKAPLEHPVDDGLQSWVNFLLLVLDAINVLDTLLGVEVYTFGWNIILFYYLSRADNSLKYYQCITVINSYSEPGSKSF